MIPKVKPYEVYQKYLSQKLHFSSPSYDYHKNNGKTRSSEKSYLKRRDRFWFEKMSRKYSDEEIVEFFISNFSTCENNNQMWIGEIVQNGEKNYTEWKRKIQSLSYLFKEESEQLFGEHKVDEVFNCSSGHPIILKKYLAKEISLETLLIYDKIFFFVKDLDKKLQDPVWETVSSLIKKYHSFVNIDVFKFKKVLKQIVVGDS